MSLVENIVNQISTKGLGGITQPQGLDLNDDTFEQLLQKGIDNISQNKIGEIGQLGVPAGFRIEPFATESTPKEAKPINTDAIEIKEINLDDFFTNIIKSNKTEEQGIFDLAKRHAAKAYSNFTGKYVADLKDFIGDAIALS